MADETENPTNELYEKFRGWISASKSRRRDLLPSWQKNVDFRRGKPFETSSNEDRIAVNKDWSLVKTKQAQLFSQVPKIRLTERHERFATAVPVFAKVLNDTLEAERVGVALDECIPDVVNAAGIAAISVGYESTTEFVDVPAIDPATLSGVEQAAYQAGQLQLPQVQVPRVIDQRYPIHRVSAADLLIPKDFEGSDFEDSPWVGRSGRMPWAEALREFGASEERPNGITEGDKEEVISNGVKSFQRLSTDTSKAFDGQDVVEFDEIFYWRHCFHVGEKNFKTIQRLVFIQGKDDPVIDEQWSGQKFSQDGKLIGSLLRPIQILTLSYVSDDAIPPSDSAIGRPQVNELIKSRSQMIKQRERSLPLRWFDVDRVDAIFHAALQNGTFQGFIPTQGDGSRAIGEVTRASFPREDFEFDKIANRDLEQAWSLGPNQAGQFSTGERSAQEAQIVNSAFQTEIGYQRARVERFFIRVAKVVAGLLALFGDFDLNAPMVGGDIHPETGINHADAERMQSWDRESISNQFVYEIRADSTILLDAEQRIQKLTRALNLTAKSGLVNPKPIIREILELSGVDPDEVMIDPEPKPPEPISISLGSVEDFLHPLVLAHLIKTGQAPGPKELEAAKEMLMESLVPPQPPQGQSPQQPQRQLPPGDDGRAVLESGAPIETPQEALPEWTLASRIDKRRTEN